MTKKHGNVFVDQDGNPNFIQEISPLPDIDIETFRNTPDKQKVLNIIEFISSEVEQYKNRNSEAPRLLDGIGGSGYVTDWIDSLLEAAKEQINNDPFQLAMIMYSIANAIWKINIDSTVRAGADIYRHRQNLSDSTKNRNEEYFRLARDMAIEIAEERWDEDELLAPRTIAKEVLRIISADLNALGIDRSPELDSIIKWFKQKPGLIPTKAVEKWRLSGVS